MKTDKKIFKSVSVTASAILTTALISSPAMGMDILGRLLVVAYTIRGDRIRLISARKADKLEQRQYEEMT